MNAMAVQINNSVKSDFSAELLDRFFDPKSYYLHNFLVVIRQKENVLPDPLSVVAIGLLVDEIINATDKTEKLTQLDRLDQFSFYRQQLFEGINYLKSSRLSTQQMMEIVGSLGKSLAETLIDLVLQQNSRDCLLDMLGLNKNQSDDLPDQKSDHLKSKTSAVPKPPPLLKKPVDVLDREPWSFFQEDINQKITLLRGHLDAFAAQPNDWQVFKAIKNDFRDLRDWSMIQGDEGIEAISHKILLLFECVYARAIDQRAQILPILKDACETLMTINQTGRGSEHLDIVRVMAHQIDSQRELYPAQFAAPEPEAVATAPVTTAVVTTESPAADLTASLLQSKTESQPPVADQPPASLTVYEEELESFIQTNLDMTKEEVPPTPLIEPKVEPQESFDSIRESELLSELINEHTEHLDDLELESVAPQNDQTGTTPAQEPTEIFLPGAEDEELLQILADLKTENNGDNHGTEPEKPKSKLASDADLDLSQFDQFIKKMKNEPITESNGAPGFTGGWTAGEPTQPAPAEVTEPKTDATTAGNGFDFVTEADIYFSFASQALQQLMKNSLDHQALEDMELACYSLRILGEKLGYFRIGEMMGYAEQAVQTALSQQSGLQTDKLNILFSVINELEHSGKERNLNETDKQKWLQKHLQLMSEWVDSNSNGKKNNQPASAAAPEKKSQADDPLDFLLFDDTSKFFKQLLSE